MIGYRPSEGLDELLEPSMAMAVVRSESVKAVAMIEVKWCGTRAASGPDSEDGDGFPSLAALPVSIGLGFFSVGHCNSVQPH